MPTTYYECYIKCSRCNYSERLTALRIPLDDVVGTQMMARYEREFKRRHPHTGAEVRYTLWSNGREDRYAEIDRLHSGTRDSVLRY